MTETVRNGILKALFVALRPIAKCLLRAGVGYKEFSTLAKLAFVEVASEEFGLRGRPTNRSRVAAMTGLSRKEVRKLRESNPDFIAEISIRESPLSLILHRWSSVSEYLDEVGAPRVLSYNNGENSFSALVASSVGDIPPGAMRTELKRVGAVTELADKSLRLEKRHFVPSGIDEKLKLGLEGSIHSLCDTVEHNCNPARKEAPRFQRLVSVDDFPADQLAYVQTIAGDRLQAFSEEFDDLLSTLEEKSEGTRSGIQVGIGLYYYELREPRSMK
jgi:hypothetical protein